MVELKLLDISTAAMKVTRKLLCDCSNHVISRSVFYYGICLVQPNLYVSQPYYTLLISIRLAFSLIFPLPIKINFT